MEDERAWARFNAHREGLSAARTMHAAGFDAAPETAVKTQEQIVAHPGLFAPLDKASNEQSPIVFYSLESFFLVDK